jgi:outer membrane murein-binding lipoprotein Lpp
VFDMHVHLIIRHLTAAALLCVAMLAGCASDQTMSKTASSGDPLASQARRMRNGEADRDGSGLSSQSRDIEKDLGFR